MSLRSITASLLASLLVITAPALASGPAVDPKACVPTAGGAQFTRCKAGTLSDGALKLRIASDLDGSKGKPVENAANQGKACELRVTAGTVAVSAADLNALAVLDGEPSDQILGDATGGMLTANNAQARLQIGVQYTRRGIDGVQVNVGARSLTCTRG